MKVIAINGSSRLNGNTMILINEIFKQLNQAGIETELIPLANKKINPCRACFNCHQKPNCIFDNDDFNEIFDKMKTADGIILASPVYTGNMSAALQALLERASVVLDMNRKLCLFKHKAGCAISVAFRSGALNVVDNINHFFLLQEMFIVGGSYFPIAYGQLPGEVIQDKQGLATMQSLGTNLADLLQALN